MLLSLNDHQVCQIHIPKLRTLGLFKPDHTAEEYLLLNIPC